MCGIVALKRPLSDAISLIVRGSCFEGIIMSRLSLVGRYLRSLFVTFGAARAVSVAVAARRQPSAQALKLLGIDPDQFRTIRLN
jgi:hypothetical protein